MLIKMKIGFVSLGCSKNLIDTEITIGMFKQNNYKIVNNPEEADIIAINTCGFIDQAKEEAINTILEMANYKKEYSSGKKKDIYSGCSCRKRFVILLRAIVRILGRFAIPRGSF